MDTVPSQALDNLVSTTSEDSPPSLDPSAGTPPSADLVITEAASEVVPTPAPTPLRAVEDIVEEWFAKLCESDKWPSWTNVHPVDWVKGRLSELIEELKK
jgi:hypothetical protein